MGDLQRHRGVFYLADTIVHNHPESVLPLMGQCVILRCEHMAIVRMYFYHALSYLFREIDDGRLVPEYRIYSADGRLFAEEVAGGTVANDDVNWQRIMQ